MSLTPGTRLGSYEVVSAIGAGGMGEVYRATDTKLKRHVAIKILPPAVATDADRLARFQREAEVLASLNHPNIAQIHGLEESGGTTALVMELVEGDDLSQRIARGSLSLDEALPIARQVAEALEAAHEQGIIHRDLKPANIMVRADGAAKVLDFGLAKATEPAGGSSANVSQSPTVTTPAMTEAGMIMGTLAYMSPEQARGRPVDRRTDIWAFGCVLYEMLTGVPAFSRETVTDTLSAITRDEPDWAVHPNIPPHINRLLRRCLDKDPRTRLRDIGEARIALVGSNIVDSAPFHTQALFPRARSGAAMWTVALLFAFAANAVTWWLASRRPATDAESLGPTITRVTADSGLTTSPAVARNGSLLAYASDRGGGSMNIWVQPLPDGQPVQITHGDEDATEPDFSPDGSRIVFRSERNGGGIYIVPALGGGERFVAPKGRRPRFSPDGKSIVYSTGGRGSSTEVWIVDDAGASPRRLAVDLREPQPAVWSPDGAFLATAAVRGQGAAQIRDWWLVNVQSGAATAMSAVAAFEPAGLSSNHGPAAWVDGEILFSATTGDVLSLWAIAVSADGHTVTGSPRRLTAGVGSDGAPSVARGADDLTIYFANTDARANLYRLPLLGAQSAASLDRVTDAAASDIWPSVSADGRTLVFASNRSSDWRMWSRDLSSGREVPLTGSGGAMGMVSSDGLRVSYSTTAQFPFRFVVRPIGGGATKPLAGDLIYVWSWPSPAVLFGGASAGGDVMELRVVDPSSGNVRSALADLKQGFYGHGQLSPDGRWASAMEWSSADRARIIMFPFRDTPVPPVDWVALTEDQSVEEEHVWSPQGDAIYFVSERDGNRCVWTRKLEPATKHPVGPAMPVLHLHGARRSMISTALRPQRIALAQNSLFFSVQEQRGNIWKATFKTN